MKQLQGHFRPEFLNRVDDTVLFTPLTLEHIKRIVSLMTSDLAKRLEERGLQLVLSDEALEYIADAGFDPIYGARPLKRFLQHALETKIGRALISGDAVEGAVIHAEVKDGELMVRTEAGG